MDGGDDPADVGFQNVKPGPSGLRLGRRTGLRSTALTVVVVTMICAFLASARPVGAVVGDCVSGQNWGTLDASLPSQVLTLVNDHRTGMGLGALSISPTLTSSANWKSLHMAYYGYMQHDDPAPPTARTPSDRLEACGYPIGSVTWGENIAYGYASAQAVMTAWLNSSGHRANIEDSRFRAIGIGVARSAGGVLYWTQEFGSLVDSGSGAPPAPPPVAPPPVAPPPASPPPVAPPPASPPPVAPPPVAPPPASSPPATPQPGAPSPTSTSTPEPTPGIAPTVSASSAPVASKASKIATRPRVRFTRVPRARSAPPRFAWKIAGSPTRIVCSLDGARVKPCSSPLRLTVRKNGPHTFIVTATNAAGTGRAKHTWKRFPRAG